MKTQYYILILFIALINLACTSSVNQIKGNWFVCTDQGEYMELYTKRNSFRITTNKGISTSWTNYRIDNDTIYFKRPGEWNDSTKAFLKYIPKKTLYMYFKDVKESHNFQPLKAKVDNIEDDYFLLIGNKERSKYINCDNNKNNY